MSQDYVIKNVSEDLVELYIKECIEAADVCGCPRCHADILAYTLNHFPPSYVVTDMGDILVRTSVMSTQFKADVITEIMTAIKLVGAKPRHTEEESQAYWIERRNAEMKIKR